MAISEAMNAKLNEQIAHEFTASQIYLSMACMFSQQSLDRLSKLFRAQVEEEREHAMKILDYVLEVGGQVKLAALPAPPLEWPTVLAAIEAALAHERKVTGQINDLVALAEKEKDYASRSFLSWFVDEQVEEEASMGLLADVARMAGDHLLQLEAYVGHLLAARK
jgi:ferritin